MAETKSGGGVTEGEIRVSREDARNLVGQPIAAGPPGRRHGNDLEEKPESTQRADGTKQTMRKDPKRAPHEVMNATNTGRREAQIAGSGGIIREREFPRPFDAGELAKAHGQLAPDPNAPFEDVDERTREPPGPSEAKGQAAPEATGKKTGVGEERARSSRDGSRPSDWRVSNY